MIAAAHLIPIAEKLGLVRLIDRSSGPARRSQTLQRFPEARLTLNVSGITATDPRWFGQLDRNADRTARHQHERLTVEITETVALDDLNETVRFIANLRDLGCAVAIDDFGAGYTSFRNLKVLNVDIVKLDGSFCENLSANRDNQYFVALAHRSGEEIRAQDGRRMGADGRGCTTADRMGHRLSAGRHFRGGGASNRHGPFRSKR